VKNSSARNFRYLGRTLAVAAVGFTATVIGAGQAGAQPTFTVTKNAYNGSDWWGTITFRNNGPVATANFQVEFDIPAGKHCTAEPESVPPGATLSPLTGSGSSARTVSNHCVFTWNNTTPLQPGQTKTFNYSTDTQSFSSASNLRIKDHDVGAICSTFAVTKNVYDGPDWWGTITFKNGGPYNAYNFKVEFDIPAGYHCTNDYVPPGATLSPLNGTGPSAYTPSNHCVYSWSNASPIAPGGSKTINYSTDNNKTSFTSASNLRVSDQQTCVGTPSCTDPGNYCSDSGGPACCDGSSCVEGTCQPNACLPEASVCVPLGAACCPNLSCACSDPLDPTNCHCIGMSN
jgi:hypothetical protein